MGFRRIDESTGRPNMGSTPGGGSRSPVLLSLISHFNTTQLGLGAWKPDGVAAVDIVGQDVLVSFRVGRNNLQQSVLLTDNLCCSPTTRAPAA
jgi:hypothetical protein